jgi:hypothetical protein
MLMEISTSTYILDHISLVFSLHMFISAYISNIAEKMSGQLEVLLSIYVYFVHG